MSYIEREKAIENVSQIRLEVVGARAVGKTIFTEALRIYRDAVLKSLNEAPTADVVEVVRCKDCKWCEDLLMSGLYCNHPDNRNPINCLPTDFCNCGERNEK